MNKQPHLHDQTYANLRHFLSRPGHALLLAGEDGTGKLYIARWIADELGAHTTVVESLPDKQMIGIEQIQALYTYTRTGVKSCIIIRDAHLLTTEAQNALLKLLEEPPQNTCFVLTVTDDNSVLTTIRSRCQLARLVKPSFESTLAYLTREFSTIDQQLLLTTIRTNNARLGAITTVLNSTEALDEHKTLVEEAKQFYSANQYQRLKLLSKHNFDRTWCQQLLSIIALIIESLITSSTTNNRRIAKLSQQTTLLNEVSRATVQSGNPKIHMTKLALNL